MNPLESRPFTSIGKSNFSPIVIADRPGLLEWWRTLPKDWQEIAASGKHSMQLLWLAERGLVTTRSAIQWHPPKRPPYCVSVIMEHSGPFVYLRFLEAFGKLHCVLPEWRESLCGSDWEVPTITHYKSNRDSLRDENAEDTIAAIESLAKYRGQNGVMTGKERAGLEGQSREEAIAAVQKQGFPCRIVEVKFDGVAVFELRRKAAAQKRYSDFREPQEWLRLRKLKGLSNSRNIWPALLKKHGDDIKRESTKSAQISLALAQEWKLDLPEFRDSVPLNAQQRK